MKRTRKPAPRKTEAVLVERVEQTQTVEDWERRGWRLVDSQSFGQDLRLVFQRGRALSVEVGR